MDTSKANMLNNLTNAGFLTPHWIEWTGNTLTDKTLAYHLNVRRNSSEYEIDGIVIDVNEAKKRLGMNPTKDTLNPAYSVKYKVAAANNQAQTTVVDVKWNLSKHGYWKPTIHFTPVNLCGVTISNCTGFNAKFIYDNSINKGAKIQITRSGDVIPFCQKVIKPAECWQEPDGDWEWNETGVDAILVDADQHNDVQLNRLVDFFSAIDAPYLKKGNIQKLFDEGCTTPESIIVLSKATMRMVLGENGKKAYDGLHEKLSNIPLYKLMGAYSNERGIGIRRMKILHDALGADVLFDLCGKKDIIASVDRFDIKTAGKVVLAASKFYEFYEKVSKYITLASQDDLSTSNSLANEKIVFTGFRDKELQEAIESAGGTMQSSVSSKTTIVVTTDPNGSSTKIKKARDLGIKILSIDEMKQLI